MKKVLLTTSALTLIAGAAAADISLSGTGRIGVISTGGTTAVTHRLRINFTGSGQTDGGLTFGFFSRVQLLGGVATTSRAAPRLWIGNGTATLTVGNAGGAVATAGNIWGCAVGFTGACADMPNPNFTWVSNSSGGAGASVIRVDFSLGSAKVSLSGGNASGGAANDTEVAATFNLGAAKVGVSYDNGATTTGGTQVHVGFNAGSANIGVHYARNNSGITGTTATVSYAMGPGKLYVAAGKSINAAGTASQNTVALSYGGSLGGGASWAVSYRKVGTAAATTDAGVKFKF